MRKFIDIITLTESEHDNSESLLALLENHGDPLGVVSMIKTLHNQFLEEYNATLPTDRSTQFNATRSSPFHLSPCNRCKSPVWQQPCPVCNYYPRGNYDDDVHATINSPEWLEYAEKLRQTARDSFIRLANHYGNLAAWYFENKKKTVAYKSGGYFSKFVNEYIEKAKELPNFPDAEAIWDAYSN